MKKYRLYQVDAFTKERFRGNPAAVIPNADGLSDSQMQLIAREMNNSETAFVFEPRERNGDVRIRFFTPSTEVPSCGHATIAAHYVRAQEMGLASQTVVQRIGAGILPVDVIREENDYRIVMTQGAPEFGDRINGKQRDDVLCALGLRESDLIDQCPVQIVSTGHSKVLVGIRERATLSKLKPNLAQLAAISEKINCNGYFVFVINRDSDDVLTHGRMFAPAIGIPEDPVTGNANGPLGAYLVKYSLVPTTTSLFRFTARQGDEIGRPGTLEVTVAIKESLPTSIQVGGHAVTIFNTELAM